MAVARPLSAPLPSVLPHPPTTRSEAFPRFLVSEFIAFFAVLRQVEPGALVLFAQPEPYCLIHDEQDDQGTHNGQGPCDGYANRLVQYLPRIPFEHACCLTCPQDGVDGAAGEFSGQQCSDRSTGAMNTKGVERIVISERGLHLNHH